MRPRAVIVASVAAMLGSCESSRVCNDPSPRPGVDCGAVTCTAPTPVCCGTATDPFQGLRPPYATLDGHCVASVAACLEGTAHECDESTDCARGQKCCVDVFQSRATCRAECEPAPSPIETQHEFQECREDCECGASGWCERSGDWKNFCCLPEGALCNYQYSGPAIELCCSQRCVTDNPDSRGSNGHCR
jgi:hypothetical protein